MSTGAYLLQLRAVFFGLVFTLEFDGLADLVDTPTAGQNLERLQEQQLLPGVFRVP